MDSIDLIIIQSVEENARISIKDISARINLSIPATSERLKKLEKSGIIKGYTVIVDHEKLKKNFCCFCLVVLNSPYSTDTDFMNYVQDTNDILECHRVTGTYEYLLKIKTSSPRSLETLLATLRDRWGVAQSLTHTVLSTFKEKSSAIPESAEHLR